VNINITGSITLLEPSSSYTFNIFNVTGNVDPLALTNFSLNTSFFTNNKVTYSWSIGTNIVGGLTEVQAVLTEAVPEPSTYALFGFGVFALLLGYRIKVA
jgi:hypothetical protein